MLVLQDQSTLPNTLATICNDIALNGSVCDGFTFDSATNLAVFKGQAALEAVDIASVAQPSDTADLWWLDAGKPQSPRHYIAVIAIPGGLACLSCSLVLLLSMCNIICRVLFHAEVIATRCCAQRTCSVCFAYLQCCRLAQPNSISSTQ